MSKVLNLPPLSNVTDPATRSALQAVYQWMQVRDGQVRDGANKFLTEADATRTINQYFQAGAGNATYPPGASPGSIQGVVDSLARSVINSATYQDLMARIERIEQPSWLQSAIQAAVGNVYNMVQVQAVRQDQAAAAIGRAVDAQATGERATVTALNALMASWGVNTSGITELSQVTTTASTAYAGVVTQLNNDLGDAAYTAQQAFTLSSTVEGWVKAQYSVKVDLNGYVAGFAFGVEGEDGYYTSDFIVAADTFAIAAPGLGEGDPVVPFIVRTSEWTDSDGVTQPAGLYADNIVVRAAQIGDGVVGGFLQSGSYDESEQTGWRLNPDGSAYFGGDVTIDGVITAEAFGAGFDTLPAGSLSNFDANSVTSLDNGYSVSASLMLASGERALCIAVANMSGGSDDPMLQHSEMFVVNGPGEAAIAIGNWTGVTQSGGASCAVLALKK